MSKRSIVYYCISVEVNSIKISLSMQLIKAFILLTEKSREGSDK